MIEEIKWEGIYQRWEIESYRFFNEVNKPVFAETVFVEFDKPGYFYGHDWLENQEAQKRKQLIKNNPAEFLYFTKHTNKGTIKTAEMLIEAQNEEELAAIWMAATAKELYERGFKSSFSRYADKVYVAACDFLNDRYWLWHHAMKGLVPMIMIPYSVLESVECEDAGPIIGLIVMNTILLKNNFSILRYSSLKDGEIPDLSCRKRPQ